MKFDWQFFVFMSDAIVIISADVDIILNAADSIADIPDNIVFTSETVYLNTSTYFVLYRSPGTEYKYYPYNNSHVQQ